MKTSPGYTRIPSLSCNTNNTETRNTKSVGQVVPLVPQGVVTVSTSLVSASKCWDDNYISPSHTANHAAATGDISLFRENLAAAPHSPPTPA